MTRSAPMPSCHFLNSATQLRMVLRGQTTRAVRKRRVLDCNMVCRKVTTWTQGAEPVREQTAMECSPWNVSLEHRNGVSFGNIVMEYHTRISF